MFNSLSLIFVAFIVTAITAIRDNQGRRLRTCLIIFGAAATGFMAAIVGSYSGFGSPAVWGHLALPLFTLAGLWAALRKNKEAGWKSWRAK